MCLITTPREDQEYIKETYIAPRPASTHSRRSHSQVYAYRDGTFAREYTTPTVVRSEYAPSTRSHRSHRSDSSRRSSHAYITGVPATSPTRVREVQYPTEMVPVARTETVYVTEEVTPNRIEVTPVTTYPRRERIENVYTTGGVSPALMVEEGRRSRGRVYY